MIRLNTILEYLVIIGVSFAIAFGISWGIVESWVLFWDFGWIWNEVTVPPMVVWDIFFSNIITILILASVITVFVVIIILYSVNN